MADYTTVIEAEQAARDLVDAGTVIEAFVCATSAGDPAVRILRPVSASGFDSTEGGQSKGGLWATIQDSANA